MFEKLCTDGPTIEKCRTAPLLDEPLCWLEPCAQAGARQSALWCKLAVHQVQLVDLWAGDRVGITGIEPAAEQWILQGRRQTHIFARLERLFNHQMLLQFLLFLSSCHARGFDAR